jgi:hypothetical protein
MTRSLLQIYCWWQLLHDTGIQDNEGRHYKSFCGGFAPHELSAHFRLWRPALRQRIQRIATAAGAVDVCVVEQVLEKADHRRRKLRIYAAMLSTCVGL